MTRIPSLSGEKVIALLKKHGFKVDRVNGSHHIMKHRDPEDGRGTTVSVHGGKDLPKGTLRAILTDVDLTPDELLNPKMVKDRDKELTPDQVNRGVTDPKVRRDPGATRIRGGGRRAANPQRQREERSRRR
jgi:predicted RNA binding protein YcfA (HicA-like mRNA interferase family)